MLTGYARLTRRQARVALAILTLSTLFFVGVAVSPLWQGKAQRQRRGAGDVALYQAEVDRIHNGDGYYQAAAAELTARGYPTRSIFNWRTPLPMWLIGKLPQVEWGKYILGALSLGMIFLAFKAIFRDQERPFFTALACAALLSGPLLFSLLDDLFVMPVLWAGIFIALSLCAYGNEKPLLGMGLGLAALFFRELALPYCLLCAAMAFLRCFPRNQLIAKNSRCIHRGLNNREFICWALGLSAWAIFFAWHWAHVSTLIGPDARAHPNGWIGLGGAGFVLATAQVNAYLLLLPPWVTALYFAAALFGLAGWHARFGTRVALTVCMYIMAFAFVGQDFNQYWGALIGPLLCFGVVRLPASMRDLWHAAGITIRERSPTCLR